MKFKWKIFLLCMSIYIITLASTSVLVTEDTFSKLLNKEIERALKEEKNIHDSTVLYLISNQNNMEETLDIKDYSSRIVDMFSGEKEIIEIYNREVQVLASSLNKIVGGNREELSRALSEGRCYILRKYNGENYIFIADTIKIKGNEVILSYVKNIEDIYKQKNEQYFIFLRVGILGLVFIALIAALLSKIIIKPIENLSKAASHIASGNFNERVVVKGKDEIADLSNQFNVMVAEVEMKIYELKEEGERKQRFTDNLTHELRTPLTSIIGYSELLKGIKYEEATFTKGLKYIYTEGQRMLKLISSLMDMILIRENNIKLQPVDTLHFLEDISNLLRFKTEEKHICLLVQAESFIVNVDEDMIKEVILNLLDNSIKASEDGGKIILGAEKFKGLNSIYVQDEGKGMKEEEIAKVTEPFYRVDKSRARKAGGVGLGLSICKEIANKHGAEILIVSKLNEGTKVSIIFKEVNKGEVDIA